MIINNLKRKLEKKYINLINVASYIEVIKAERIFYINYLSEGMTVFDVGANIGELSLLFSSLVGDKGQVHSFEPCQKTFNKLSQICDIIQRPQIKINHKAVSKKQDLIKLYVYDDEYSTLNSMADRPLENYGLDIKPNHIEEVESITIDQYCQENNISHINLLKIDVEGAEYQVLLGTENMLKNKKIDCCLFEFGQTTFDMGNKPSEIEKYLNKLGYKVRNLIKGNPNFPGSGDLNNASFSIHVAMPRSKV